jgi:hypothetical protein
MARNSHNSPMTLQFGSSDEAACGCVSTAECDGSAGAGQTWQRCRTALGTNGSEMKRLVWLGALLERGRLSPATADRIAKER